MHWLLFPIMAVLVAACSSSSSRIATDGGVAKDAASAGDAGRICSPFGTPECEQGETCCLSQFAGTCRNLSACPGNVQFECSDSRQCKSPQICCGRFVDAPDGGITATTFCTTHCAEPGHRLCITSDDCADAAICTPLPEGSNSPILAAAVEAFLVCLPPDSGAAP